jgi:hypothetical protein
MFFYLVKCCERSDFDDPPTATSQRGARIVAAERSNCDQLGEPADLAGVPRYAAAWLLGRNGVRFKLSMPS